MIQLHKIYIIPAFIIHYLQSINNPNEKSMWKTEFMDLIR